MKYLSKIQKTTFADIFMVYISICHMNRSTFARMLAMCVYLLGFLYTVNFNWNRLIVDTSVDSFCLLNVENWQLDCEIIQL